MLASEQPESHPTAISTKTADFVSLCRCAPPDIRAVESKRLGNPLGQAGERLEPSGALFARARCSFCLAIFLLIFCMPGGARVTTGSIFEILTS
jgi:hypothetical protein